ncbi:MAG: 4-(cytidine 5'-diphospho)-2-C-methyl-D-erythritol kinase [Chthoniobacterales bacterium]
MRRVNHIQLDAPAKINLSFTIRARRADGFHEIETLMAPISLSDRLTISEEGAKGEITLVCDDTTVPTGDDNLVVRAARLFLKTTGTRMGLKIDLQKNIPHGAGLGGGSSDAASTLLGLQRLCGTRIEKDELTQLAAQIGSDVPFFLSPSAAICRGRGELVTPCALGQRLRLLLVKPRFGVPTAWAYARWKDAKELPGVSYGAQEFGGTTFVNDLERPVFEKHVFLARVKLWLLAQSEVVVAMLSGSGSTMFAVLRDAADAEALAARAKAELDPELWTHASETL